MNVDLSLSICTLEKYNRDTKLHTSFWTRLIWLANGEEAIFIRAGISDEMERLTGKGWALQFNQFFLTGFLERYNLDYHNSLMKSRAFDAITIPLTAALRDEFNSLAVLLSNAQADGQAEMYLQAYGDLILLNINHVYANDVII